MGQVPGQAPPPNPGGPSADLANPENPQAQAQAAEEPSRAVTLRGAAGLTEYYDSNVAGTQNGGSDSTTQAQLDLGLHAQTRRIQADLAYSLSGYFHANQPQFDSIENYLNAVGRAELYEEHLFLNARAFAWPTFLSRLGSLNQTGSANANRRNAYGYALEPDFAWRFADILRADLIVSHSGVFFSDLSNASGGSVLPLPGPTDAVATGLKLRLTGGDYFGRMEWVFEASGVNSTQSGFHDKRRSVSADLEYHIDRNFGVIANLGYRDYNTRPTLTRGISGPIAMAGLTFRANESFTAVIKAGTQYQFTSVTGNVRYQFTPTSQFYFALDDVVTTPQDRLLLGLGGVETFQGGFYAPGTLLPNQATLTGLPGADGQPINLLPMDGLALDNIISRYRTAMAGLIHRMPRTTLSFTAYGTVRDYLLPLPGFDLRQTIYGANISVSRELRRDLTGSLTADYSVANEFGGIDKLATISAFLNYMISEKWSANLRISYLDRQARTGLPFASGPLSNVQAGVGVRYNF